MDPRDNLLLDLLITLGKHNIPIIGGFVRDIIIPEFYPQEYACSKLIQNHQKYFTSKYRRYNDIDLIMRSEDEAQLILNDLPEPDILQEIDSQGVYPWPRIVAIFGFERIEFKIDFIICEQYIPTDFDENNIYYFPPLLNSLNDLKSGELIATQEIIDNLLNNIVTMKPEYVRKIVGHCNQFEYYNQESKEIEDFYIKLHQLTHRFDIGKFYNSVNIKFYPDETQKNKNIILSLQK